VSSFELLQLFSTAEIHFVLGAPSSATYNYMKYLQFFIVLNWDWGVGSAIKQTTKAADIPPRYGGLCARYRC
jgi:hypothetical protein